jgi:hypothetical protein
MVSWQWGIHDHILRADEDPALCAKYVVENPVRAGIVKEFKEYAY